MEIELLIQNGNTVYAPVTQDEIVWTTERKSSPGKLEFKVLKDNIINYEEGNPISFKVTGNPLNNEGNGGEGDEGAGISSGSNFAKINNSAETGTEKSQFFN
jgi:hypothetical protein